MCGIKNEGRMTSQGPSHAMGLEYLKMTPYMFASFHQFQSCGDVFELYLSYSAACLQVYTTDGKINLEWPILFNIYLKIRRE